MVFYIALIIAIAIVVGIIASLVFLFMVTVRWASKSPKNTYTTFAVIGLTALGIFLCYRYVTRYSQPYYFWNELSAKNSKPFWTSITEYETKNRQGFCWRDGKYYNKTELLAKAKRSLVELLQMDAIEMQNGRAFVYNGAMDQYEIIRESLVKDCQKERGNCRVHVIPKEMTITDTRYNNPNRHDLLNSLSDYSSYDITTNAKYIESILKSNKNYVILPVSYSYTYTSEANKKYAESLLKKKS